MRQFQRRLDRLEGSGGSDDMFVVPLTDGDVSGYPPEQLTTVEVLDPSGESRSMVTVPGLIVCRNSAVPQLLKDIAGRSRLIPYGSD